MRQFRVDGASAVITGAGTGIGRACAVALAEAGAARLILNGRRPDKLAEAVSAVRAAAPQCDLLVVAGDVTEAGVRSEIRRRLAEKDGRLDFLVNNAGLFEARSLRETGDDVWARHLEVNLTAPFQLLRELVDLFKGAPDPAVVNVSSTLAEKPIPSTAAYNAAKAGLVQLTRTLALELGPERVRVNCVMPAIVDTPMYRGRYKSDEEYRKSLPAIGKIHPIGRIGTPADVANAVLFLCSPAASWITGVSLPVDGGMLCT